MNLHPFSAASVFLGVYLILSAVGRAQEGPGQAYRRATSVPVAVPATVVKQVAPAATFGKPVALPAHGGWIPAPRPLVPAQRVWVPGHRELVQERVWVPGAVRRVWVPPVYETRCGLWGQPVHVQVSPGHWQNVQDPGHYELRSKRVWRPGYWRPLRY